MCVAGLRDSCPNFIPMRGAGLLPDVTRSNTGPMQQGAERAEWMPGDARPSGPVPGEPKGTFKADMHDYHLPTASAARKGVPMATGLLDYFPDALADVARLSKIGNDQNNPGEPLHWAREKSSDHADCIMRHMVDRDVVDTDGVLHITKVAWRALALLQLTLEKRRDAQEPATGRPQGGQLALWWDPYEGPVASS